MLGTTISPDHTVSTTMTFGCVVQLRDGGVIVEKNDPIQIGFGDDIFPPLVMRKIEDMRK